MSTDPKKNDEIKDEELENVSVGSEVDPAEDQSPDLPFTPTSPPGLPRKERI